jgi:pumilio RNA-binding family
MSQHKYASNVVEGCLKHGSPPQRVAILGQLLRASEGEGGPLAVPALARHKYGNYVVQRALQVSENKLINKAC